MTNADGPVSPSKTISSRVLWQLVTLNAALTAIVLSNFARLGFDYPESEGCVETFIDFHVFWAAGKLALEGNSIAAFDQPTLLAAFESCNNIWLPWLHPAPAMLLVTPFALLPFIAAWVLFNAMSLLALGLALRQFCAPKSNLFVGLLFAPAMLPALLAGQFTLLWIAGLLGAIGALRADRHIAAGLLIGLLTLKPTLGLLIPFALLAIWSPRAIVAAICATVILQGCSTLVYGLSYWTAWTEISGEHAAASMNAMARSETMASVSTFLARLGVAPKTAVAINFGFAAILALVVFVVWRRQGVHSDAGVALLFAAIPLATPYLWQYDAAFVAISGMFLIRSKGADIGILFGIGLTALWIGPGLLVWNSLTVNRDWLAPVWLLPPIMLLALAISLQQQMQNSLPSRRR